MRSSFGKHSLVVLLTGIILLSGGARASRAQAPLRGQARPRPLPAAIPLTTATRMRTLAPPTSGTLKAYSSRPLMAVGDLLAVNLTNRTVTVAIDRARSSLPAPLVTAAARLGELEKLKNREFPARRTFPIGLTTSLLDERLLAQHPEWQTDTEKERLQKITIKLNDFKPGQRVSVLFITHPDPSLPPTVLNVKKQDPARTDYDAMYRQLPLQHRILDDNEVTTQVRANAVPTTSPLPRGVMPPPTRKRTDGK